MSDFVYGDKVGGNQYKQVGDHNQQTVTHSDGLTRAELDAAIAELRSLVAELARDGMVASDGTVTDPGAVVAVNSRPGRFQALTRALVGGARDAVLSAVQGGVAALVTALVRPM
ncbi:hypothetical protein [Streptomyces sp. AS02]|uniref:hypothetical protein n=1 Tax=Streptomyces sp. AS02 TaxID=2938946 RepID=UPI0020221D51|nr:hypothetical protein [Streptomyces sp. AS02]MCL8014427.1 hypothetical protein [Streptomyces sp. AS02]